MQGERPLPWWCLGSLDGRLGGETKPGVSFVLSGAGTTGFTCDVLRGCTKHGSRVAATSAEALGDEGHTPVMDMRLGSLTECEMGGQRPGP